MFATATVTNTTVPGELFCLQAMFPDDGPGDVVQHPLLAYGATADPDTLYYHEAMKAPDKQNFVEAMAEEVNGQLANKVYRLKRRKDLPPPGIRVLPAVWAM
jgi:hypothetical protein